MALVYFSPKGPPGGGKVKPLPHLRPMHEPQLLSAPTEGYCDWRMMMREDIIRSIIRDRGENWSKYLALDRPDFLRLIRSKVQYNFKDPDLIAIFRMGEEGLFRELVEAAWAATPEVSADVIYIPDTEGGQGIFYMRENPDAFVPYPFSARVENYRLSLEKLRAENWFAVAAVTLGSREKRLGSLVLAWRTDNDKILARLDRQALDPFIHLKCLDMIGTDLTVVFAEKPAFLDDPF